MMHRFSKDLTAFFFGQNSKLISYTLNFVASFVFCFLITGLVFMAKKDQILFKTFAIKNSH